MKRTTAGAPAADGGAAHDGPPYRIGTLVYTKAALFAMFSWLLWGNLCFQLFESAGGPGILGLYLQDNFHVSNLQVNILFNLIPQLIGMVMTPIIGFKSDRTRTRWGRRIPYMVVTAPFLCLFAAGVGFSDEIVTFFKLHLSENSLVQPFTAALIAIGALTVGFSFFNEFVGTVYWYLFADVVPERFLGRFMGLFRLVGFGAGLLTNALIVPYQLTHLKAIHVGLAALYFVGFGLMCWRVKEGEYPPVTDVTKQTTVREQVGIFFRECFTHPIYVLFYLMSAASVLTIGTIPAGIFNLHISQHQSSVPAHPGGAAAAAATPDGSRWVSGGRDGLVKLWRCPDKGAALLVKTLRGEGGAVLCVAVAGDGLTVAAGRADGRISIWDAQSGRLLQTATGHTGAVCGVAFRGDGKRLASAGADRSVRVWDIPSGACQLVLEGHAGPVNAVAWSANGERLISGGSDRRVVIWDAARGVRLQTLDDSPGPVQAVCFAPALEKRAGPDATPRDWWARTFRLVAEQMKYLFTNESLYDTPADAASRIALEDGWAVAGGQDGNTNTANSAVRIWALRTGKLLQELTGHKASISSVAYKADIRAILSGSYDSSIRLWMPLDASVLAGDQSLKTFSGYTHEVTAIAPPASGKRMLTACGDGTIHFWDLDEGVSLRKNGMSLAFFMAISILLAYPLGVLVDRLHPVRITLWMTIAGLPFAFLPFWLVHDYMSGFWVNMVRMPLTSLLGAAWMPMTVMLFPRSKYGQMCSANALIRQAVAAAAGLLGALLMDWLTANSFDTDNYRYGFLFQGIAGVLGLMALLGIYRHWKRLGGMRYVAPEV